MGKKIVVTEKPSVAMEYAKILGVSQSGRKNGFIENDEWVITWCVGHLVTMSYPQVYSEEMKKWSLDTLPFLPEKYLYEVIVSVKEQFKVIKTLYNRSDIDTIYYAGDSGREGIYIQALVRMQAGHKTKDERVVWIDSFTEEEIMRGIKTAKPISEYMNLIASGYARGIEDYAMGINFSRAMTCKYGNLVKSATGSDKASINVGRVMSCVLAMIVERENEILNFKETDYYKVNSQIIGADGTPIDAEWKVTETSHMYNSPLLYNESGFKTEDDAKKFIASLPASVTIKSIGKKTEKKYAPLLFNLAELQNECSKLYKISPDKTLEIAQSLYEKKMTTYPRTDARVLSSAVAKEIEKTVYPLTKHSRWGMISKNVLTNNWHKGYEKSKYVDDSKITDHYAIIPTGLYDSEKDLDELEKNVYDLIVRRFMATFYPPAEYLKVNLEESVNKEFFGTGISVLKVNGYLDVAGVPKEDEERRKVTDAILSLKEGALYGASYNIIKGTTTPPKRYTSGSLILAMENAGNLIEDEELRAQIKGSGIGTSATRAEIISKLCKIDYIALNSKTQVITPTDTGNIIYITLKATIPQILTPKMTASWEKGLEGVANGSVPYKDYLTKLNQFVSKQVELIKSSDLAGQLVKEMQPFAKGKTITPDAVSKEASAIGTCPFCGGNIMRYAKNYGCDGWRDNGCKFYLPIQCTDIQVKRLLTTGSSGIVSNLKKKNGTGTYKASFVINKEENKIDMKF